MGLTKTKLSTTDRGLDTISQLGTINAIEDMIVTVKEDDRAGTFIAKTTGTANFGTVFAGTNGLFWHRQFIGAYKLSWFGLSDSIASIRSLQFLSGDAVVSLNETIQYKWDADSVDDDDGWDIIKVTAITTGRYLRIIPTRTVSTDAKTENVNIVRHKYLASKIYDVTTTTIPQGICVGNSIMQGSGSSSISFTIPFLLAAKLQSLTGVLTTNDWAPKNYGVGGSTTAVPACYVADNNDTTDNFPQSGQATDAKDYAIVLTLRNDAGALSIDHSAILIRRTLLSLIEKGIEPIFVTDPPKTDVSTGEVLDTQASFGDLYDRSIAICGDLGVTVVDAWKHFNLIGEQGADLREFTGDGTHPNDLGYITIANLIYDAMIAPSVAERKSNSVVTSIDKAEAVAAYVADGGTVTTTTTISGLVTASTSRKVETGEGTVEAFVLGDTDTIQFDCPDPIQGVIINMLGGESGHVTAQFANLNISGTFSAESGTVREKATMVNIASSSTIYNKVGFLKLTSVGITRILGATFLKEKRTNDFGRWIDAVETGGAWSDTTFDSGGEIAKENSTIGDYVTLSVYGSFLRVNYERSTSEGKFEYSVDGGSTTEVDCYLNAAATFAKLHIDLGSEGWHTVKLEVTTKNVSAVGNNIKLGTLIKYTGSANPDFDYIAMNAADVIDTRTEFNKASIVKTISGTPEAHNGLSDNTFTLGGSGSALVLLEK